MARVVAVAVMAVGMSVARQEVEFQMRHEQEARSFRSREAVIRADLYTVRSCIDQHVADKGCYPDSLQKLVDEGFLRTIPVDPFSGTNEGAWEALYAEPSELDDECVSGNQVIEVRYPDDTRVALDGTLICQW